MAGSYHDVSSGSTCADASADPSVGVFCGLAAMYDASIASSPQSSALHLYNTLTKREEEFVPLEKGVVKMYTCGPTVYGRPHIGNYSSFLMADLLARWLKVKGYDVRQVKNITDVGHLVADADHGEDKIQKQAEREKIDPLDVARKYTEEYLEDEAALRFLEPFARPRATETVKEMIAIIQTLIKGGHAYETEDGIYFDVNTFSSYGQLSGNTLENLASGSRISIDEKKRHPADFALWKKCVGPNARHLLRWSFPAGERVNSTGEDSSVGFPGWHIECSAMSRKFLGEHIDIHTGGEDNIFPHHECEIAQSESSCLDPGDRAPFARYWLHRRFIDMGDVKMSKSLGNVLTLPDIVAKGFSPLDLRYYLLSVHYRTNLKFTEKGLEDARKARRKITEWMEEVSAGDGEDKDEEFSREFDAAMDNDLNTPAALAVVFTAMNASRSKPSTFPQVYRKFVDRVRQTFGCFEPEEEIVPPEVKALLIEREAARVKKDFSASDSLRMEIEALGYSVKDTPAGQKIQRI